MSASEPPPPPPGPGEWRLDFEARPPRTRGGAGPRPGKKVAGRYELGEVLGRGACGVVHRALDPTTGRTVALKLLRGSLTPAGRERFRREVAVTAALDHPGIVRLLDSGESDVGPFLVHELVEGATTLEQAMPRLDRARRVALVRRVAEAMGHAHARGVVHRDLKESNVLVDASGLPRVIDFGLSWTREVDSLTESGALVGTPRTMAPEQLLGQRDRLGPATDVWALGTILYTALAGVPPFPAESLPELAARILDPPLPLAEHDPTIAPALEAVCRRCLAREPERRFADAGELGDALDLALAGARERRAGRALVLGGLGLAAALGLGLLVATGGSPPPPTPGSSPTPSRSAAPTATPTARAATPTPQPRETASTEARLETALLEATAFGTPRRAAAAFELSREILAEHEDAAAALLPLAGLELEGDAAAQRAFLVAVVEVADLWLARASSDSGPEWIAEHAVDGNLETCWSSSGRESADVPEWLAVNLGSVRVVTGVRLHPRILGLGFPRAFVIERSSDGRGWSEVAFHDTIARPAEVRWHEVPFDAPVAARAVRIRATTLGADNVGNTLFQLAEIGVVAPGGAPIAPDAGGPGRIPDAPAGWRRAAAHWLEAEAEREAAFAVLPQRDVVPGHGTGEARARRCLEGAATVEPEKSAEIRARGRALLARFEGAPAEAAAPPAGLPERRALLGWARIPESTGHRAGGELLAALEEEVSRSPADLELRELWATLLVRDGSLSRAQRQVELLEAIAPARLGVRVARAVLLGARQAPPAEVLRAVREARAASGPLGWDPRVYPELASYGLDSR